MASGQDNLFDPDQLCQSFIEITGANSAEAAMFLQENEWQLQSAVNKYLDTSSDSTPPAIQSSAIHDGGEEPPSKCRKASTETSSSHSCSSAHQASQASKAVDTSATSKSKEDPNRICVLSWNIDGLDSTSLMTRTDAACKEIHSLNPDAIFLQEVVPQTLVVLKQKFPEKDYAIFPASNQGYFTVIITRKKTVLVDSTHIHPFFSSVMGRKLQEARVNIKGIEFILYTSHLESTRQHKSERLKQLKYTFTKMSDAEPSINVLFGGDLNLGARDGDEFQIPSKCVDLWEATGGRKEAQWTWDMSKNDNLTMAGKYKPRCRFDRFYFRPEAKGQVKPIYFELAGISRVPGCSRFASDHWGIVSYFTIQ